LPGRAAYAISSGVRSDRRSTLCTRPRWNASAKESRTNLMSSAARSRGHNQKTGARSGRQFVTYICAPCTAILMTATRSRLTVAAVKAITGLEPERTFVDNGYRGHVPLQSEARAYAPHQAQAQAPFRHRVEIVKQGRTARAQLSQQAARRSSQRHPRRPERPPTARGSRFLCPSPWAGSTTPSFSDKSAQLESQPSANRFLTDDWDVKSAKVWGPATAMVIPICERIPPYLFEDLPGEVASRLR
jgi:hypothetical protein